MKINKWWRRIYPATKTDHEALTSRLNQIRSTLDQTKQMVEVRNAIDSGIFLSVDLQNNPIVTRTAATSEDYRIR